MLLQLRLDAVNRSVLDRGFVDVAEVAPAHEVPDLALFRRAVGSALPSLVVGIETSRVAAFRNTGRNRAAGRPGAHAPIGGIMTAHSIATADTFTGFI